MKNYYQVLGIDRAADVPAIKAAYRKLAVQYHPDKNKDQGAHNRFVEINEAYQVLSDPDKRLRYNYLYDSYILGIPTQRPVNSQGRTTTQARPRQAPPMQARPRHGGYSRTGPPRYARAARTARIAEGIKLTTWAKNLYLLFSAACLLFVLAILADYFIPLRYTNALLEDYVGLINLQAVNNGLGGYFIDVLGQKISIANPELVSERVTLHKTELLGFVREVTLYYQGVPLTVPAAYSVYDNFVFLPLALFITSVLGLVYRKSDLFTLRITFASLFILIITWLVSY